MSKPAQSKKSTPEIENQKNRNRQNVFPDQKIRCPTAIFEELKSEGCNQKQMIIGTAIGSRKGVQSAESEVNQ